MVLCPMKNAYAPTTHLAAALLGAAVATTLLNKQAVGVVADASNGDGPPRNSGTRAYLQKDDTLTPSGYRMSDVGFGFGVASSNSNSNTRARACCVTCSSSLLLPSVRVAFGLAGSLAGAAVAAFAQGRQARRDRRRRRGRKRPFQCST